MTEGVNGAKEDELATQLSKAGLTHAQLARSLGVSRPYVTQMLNGKKPWPEQHRRVIEQYVAGHESLA